ncbi:hypothetical protein B6D60_06620, partial [candidate division KSB1 bacterium 4484_87]
MNIRSTKDNLRIKFPLLLTVLLICVSFVHAQDFWQRLPIYGGGADIFAIGQGDQLYAYSSITNTLSTSTNAGDLWTRMDIPVEQFSDIHMLAFGISSDGSLLSVWRKSELETDNDTLFVYKSQNNGTTWQTVDTLKGSNARGGILNGTENSLFFQYKPTGYHVYPLRRSTDNGDTWTTVVPDSEMFSISAFAVNKNGHAVISSYDRILLSTDNGNYWTEITNFPGYGAGTIALNDSNHIFIATWQGQIYRSRDNGENWESIYQDNTGGTIQEIGFNSHGDIFIGTAVYNNGVSEYRLSRIPAAGGTAENLFLAYTYLGQFKIASDGSIFIATTNALYRSTDNGQTWAEIYQGLTHFMTNSFAAAPNGAVFFSALPMPLLKSTDRGLGWQKIGTNNRALDLSYSVAVHNNGVYALVDSGVYKSTDYGESWQRLTPENISSAKSITWDNGGTAYLQCTNNHLYRTTTNEQTWVAMNTDAFSTIDINQIFALPTGTLFAGVDSLAVFRSTDQGNSWTSANTGLPLESAFAFAHDSSGGIIVSVIYDSSDNRYYGGLYRSTNNGASWQPINNGLPGTAITSIVVNSVGHIYAANIYDGVYRSTDLG